MVATPASSSIISSRLYRHSTSSVLYTDSQPPRRLRNAPALAATSHIDDKDTSRSAAPRHRQTIKTSAASAATSYYVNPFTRPFDTITIAFSHTFPRLSPEQTASLYDRIESSYNRSVNRLESRPNEGIIVLKPLKKQEKECPKLGNTEKIAGKTAISNNSPVNTSPLSTIPRPCTTSTLRGPAPCLSTARIQHAPNLAPLFASEHAQSLASWLTSPLGYIRNAEEMEATGQG